jgi:hypothetical protein
VPVHFLDLMSVCWAQDPHDRPSAQQIRSVTESPEFSRLRDAVQLDADTVLCACVTPSYQPMDDADLLDNLGIVLMYTLLIFFVLFYVIVLLLNL